MSNEIQAWTDGDLAVRIVMLKAFTDLLNREFKAAKAIAAEQYPKGMGLPAWSGDVQLGRVSKSNPKPDTTVTDYDALDAYIRQHHADKLEHRLVLGPAEEIVPILRDAGRDDLFEQVTAVPGWLLAEMELKALKTPIPGITVFRPDGVVSARTEPAAVEAVKQLLAAAPVQLLELEGGQ